MSGLDVRTGSGIGFASVHSYLLVDTPNAAPSSNLDPCFCIVRHIGRYIYQQKSAQVDVDPWTYAHVYTYVRSIFCI